MDGNRTAPNRRSIAFLFDELARLNGAPECLVEQIRALFPRRGVALEQDALPYLISGGRIFEAMLPLMEHEAGQSSVVWLEGGD